MAYAGGVWCTLQYCHSMRGAAGEFPLGGPFIGGPSFIGAAVLNLNFR